ncbi:hypothetical protein [Methylomonas sp. DH-1]|uniref:hypothetical protein n=1 Tax=Methylomonas sp. (strain DH-1) TaxID=1727196 RepID=UPI000A58B47F|nr:hypothetical protein [Methylomonas sp. DH-1]
MNTIHSSSLAFYPVGYQYRQTGAADAKPEQPPLADTDAALKNRQPQSQPSSTEQIEAALAETELTIETRNAPTNSRALKALNAYTENRNQSVQARLHQTLSGIDLYA